MNLLRLIFFDAILIIITAKYLGSYFPAIRLRYQKEDISIAAFPQLSDRKMRMKRHRKITSFLKKNKFPSKLYTYTAIIILAINFRLAFLCGKLFLQFQLAEVAKISLYGGILFILASFLMVYTNRIEFKKKAILAEYLQKNPENALQIILFSAAVTKEYDDTFKYRVYYQLLLGVYLLIASYLTHIGWLQFG